VPGGDHARSLDQPGVDRPAQRYVEQITACLDEQPEVAHGGEAGAQRTAGVADRTQHPRRRIVLHLGQTGIFAAPAHEEVDLHVHQTGQQDGIPEVDNVSLGLPPNTNDSVVFDPDDSRPDDLAGFDVD
jgi:hypothetical protein